MADPGKDLGIMLYIDNNESMIEEFGWIYKSWIHSGNWRTSDLIVVHHPEVTARIPLTEPGIISIPFPPVVAPGSAFENYIFANSIACLVGPHIDPIASQYRYLLRTDADVFLTRHLATFRPSYSVHGRGRYHNSDEFREKIMEFCRVHGVKHHNHFGCGHSLLDQSFRVIHFLQRQVYWMEVLLKYFGPDPANWGSWPGWYRSIASMYAAEVTANESFVDFLFYGRERILDVDSFSDVDIDPLIFHIHAIHTYDYFSKQVYRRGGYAHIDVKALDTNKVNQYCHWIVATPVDAIKDLAGYPH